MQLRDIEYLICLAETKNFTQAATQLYISQSALSQAIIRLEEEFNVKLFLRTPSQTVLTPAGKVLYEEGQRLLMDSRRISARMADINDLRTGSLYISASRNYSRYYLSRILPVFHGMYPGIDIKLLETTSFGIEEDCRKGKADIGLVALPLTCSNLKYIPFLDETIYLCLPKDHPFAVNYYPVDNDPIVELSNFSKESFVLLTGGQRMRHLAIELCEEAGFKPRVVVETTSVATVLEFIRNGMGIGFITELVRRESSEEGVCYFRILSKGKTCKRSIAAIYSENAHLSRAAKEFIRIAREVTKE